MPFNGPAREFVNVPEDMYLDKSVYCVDCGTIYVWARGRSCPACTLAERLDAIEETLDALEEQLSEDDDE